MPFPCLVIGLLLFASAAHAILPNDLVFTPYAEFPSQNQTELGYQLNYYSIAANTTDKGVYFNHSFSKNIRYGIEFFEFQKSQQVVHHFAYRLGQLFKGSNYHVQFSGGINYLSNQPIFLNNERLKEGSLTMSWVPLDSPIRFHATAAKEYLQNNVFGMFAASLHQHWGILAIEWDGETINLSNQFTIYDRVIFRGGLTKNIADSSELVFKTSLGFIDLAHSPMVREKSNVLPEPQPTVEASPGLIHIQEGLQFYYNGDYRKAQKSYEIASEFFPHSSVVKERLGSIYYKLGEFQKALIEWENANVIAPSPRLESFINDAKSKSENLD